MAMLMSCASSLSTTATPLDMGVGRLAPHSADSEQPSFADMLGKCISAPQTEDGVSAASATVAAETPYAALLQSPAPPTLYVKSEEGLVTSAANGEDPSTTEPATDKSQEQLGTPADPVPVTAEQSPPPPFVLPAQIILPTQTTAETTVASSSADLQDEPDSLDAAEKGDDLRPGRAGPTAPLELTTEQAAMTAGLALADGADRTTAPSVATDFQQNLPPQLAAHQTSAMPMSQSPHVLGAVLPMPSPPTTPMQQVMPVVASVVTSREGAPQTLVIRLEPAELGRVQVLIERSAEGLSLITLQAERPDTLQLLVRDQPQLHRALDLAGVPTDGRLLQFQLLPDQPPLLQDSKQFGASESAGGFANPNDSGSAGQKHSNRHGGYAPASSSEILPVITRRLAGVDITA